MTESINWGSLIEQAGTQLELVAKGTYDVVVDDASDTQTSTQKLMYKIKLKITGGPYNGRVLWTNQTLTTDNPTALAMFFRTMEAFGLGKEFFATNPAPSAVAEALVGRTCRVVVDHRIYQNQNRENVKTIMKAVQGVGPVGGMPVPGGASIPGGLPAPSAPVSPSVPVPAVSPPVSPPPAPAPVAAPPAPAPEPEPEPEPEEVEPTDAPPAPPAIDLDAYRAAGWTDAQLVAAGHMEAPVAAPPAPPAPPAPAEQPPVPVTQSGPPAPPPVPF